MIRDDMVMYRKGETGQWLRGAHIKILRKLGYTAWETTTSSIALAIATDAPLDIIQRLRMD